MKKTNILGLSLVSILALTACGGGSSTNDVKTGTAYYLDSAVAGVNYKCGNREGITGVDGSFTFEEGEGCTFYLGDIKLRDMDKAQLIDGAKIVEEDIKVATLLQTLDSDGNPDNGITIKEEVVEAMATALSENGGDGTLPDTVTELEVLVASLEQVEGYDGHVVSESEALTHLNATQTEVTKELLAGKTLYAYWEEDTEKYIVEVTINADVTSWQYQTILGGSDSGTENIEVIGNQLNIKHADEDDLDPYIISKKDKYIEFDNINDHSKLYFYYNKADAQAYLDSLSGSTSSLSDLIVGKTLYQNCNGSIESITFGTNGIITWIEDGHTETENYRIDGNIVYTNDGDGEEAHPLLEATDRYIKFDDSAYDGEGETSTFYFTEADAQNAPADECGDGGNIEVSNITSGKVTFKDDNNNNIAIPTDTWIRITPSQYQEDGDWNGIRCHINSDGTFGNVCYIDENENGIREAFSNSNTTYQVAVFKNHIEPDETHWNCGEDLYKYVGNDLSSDSWTNIEVLPNNYQDRSDENCRD